MASYTVCPMNGEMERNKKNYLKAVDTIAFDKAYAYQ